MSKRLLQPVGPVTRTVSEPRAGAEARHTVSPDARVFVPPGLRQAPVLDLMCSHFVLSLAARQGPRFNVRRDLNTLLALAGRHLIWPLTVLHRLRDFLERRCKGNELWSGFEKLSTAAFMERYGVWRGPYEEGTLFFYLDEYAKESPKDLLAVLAVTGDWLSQSLKKQSTLVEKNIDALAGLLQLNRAERALLLYGTLARYQRDLRSILVEFKVNNAPEAYAAIADVAGVKASEVGEALRAGSRLERIGMVENLISEHNITDLADLMKVSEKLPPVLMREYRNQSELMAVFTRPAARSALTSKDFEYVGEDVRLLCALLREAVARKEPGVNVLLYGPPGTGKTELARVVAQAAGLELFEVEYADRDGNALSGRDRYRSLQIAQVFLKGTAQSALLFDEVEDVFPPISSEAAQIIARAEHVAAPHTGSVSGKAWVNQILESNAVPTLWVTNRIEQIDPAFRRRFAYHLELKSPPPGAREQLVRKTLEGAAVSDALVARLTERKGLTPAQIRTALRFAQLAAHPAKPAARRGTKHRAADAPMLDDLIERQLKNADQALGRQPDLALRPSVTQYSLDMLNVESRYELPRIVAALKARGHGCLCFHGAPGTGKTALAEHIAQQLERPLMIRRASDLVSKFVGETEQQMAAMFREAQAEKAVLLLDEADSFLQDRRGAQRTYEVTEVNEMLQGMERYDGIFICTTNLMDSIDQAALRRFTFKIHFKPLTAPQRETMFVVEALGGEAAALEPALRERLSRLDQLCPGDFAAVKRQVEILGESIEPVEFLAQLEAEHRIKPGVREARKIGF
ncbi:MAG: ATP-binding protein [Gammaproteobacteria bacterium]|uniref:ATP-binding protein n=1 Tax=Hydrogenophaga sp. TaxID=1904254 RepID=UPI000CB47F4C|nr:ATP-binding protein [Hydrogenophaga sp.]MBU4183838.1 ATP-binding protein [Gammaproteobacteria bacterium]PKO76771.1 MAG: ATPase [Betaproteobacteria bacterium HGW-Betaproteobacteria-15]MBU4281305.1 ATP-binding protein [Gammaproteobacteria bacterium]MBU4322049.1 ATP-binding protein [Gammaproteobacteria bacterium]MBU4507995.1 ATP-binding protein [Gammaproteobacteria bacterium]